jgi:hypothetical protein
VNFTGFTGSKLERPNFKSLYAMAAVRLGELFRIEDYTGYAGTGRQREATTIMQKVKTIQVKGKSFDVTLSDKSEFQVTYDAEVVAAESLKSLTTKLSARISREKRVNIPVAYWDKDSWSEEPGQLRMGVIIGIHGGNNNLLVKWDGAKASEQFPAFSAEFVDPKQAKELKRLGEALDKAGKVFENFKKKHSFNGWERVHQLLGESTD